MESGPSLLLPKETAKVGRPINVSGTWIEWGNTLSRRIRAMTNVLLEELVLAVKANDADSFKGWLYGVIKT